MMNSIRLTARLSTMLLFLYLACVPTALAQQEPLVDKVPADALVYVGWEGKSQMGERFAGSKFKRYIETMNFAAEWTKLTDTIRKEALKQGPEGMTVDTFIKFLPTVWDRPWVFYVRDLPKTKTKPGDIHVSLDKPSEERVNPLDSLGMALLIDAGDQANAVQQQLMMLLMSAGSDRPVPSCEVVGSWVVVQLNLPELAQELGKGGPAKGQRLSESPAFRTAMNTIKFTGKPSLACFADAKRMRESVTHLHESVAQTLKTRDNNEANLLQLKQTQEAWKQTQEAFGMDGLESISYAAGFTEQNWTSSLFIAATAGAKQQGVAQWLMDETPVSPKTLSLVPAYASWFGIYQLDLFSTQQMLVKQGSALAGNLGEVHDPLIEINKALGFDLGQELLSQIGPDWVFFTDPFTVGPAEIGFVMAAPLKDPARVERALTLLETKANALLAPGNKDGASFSLPIPPGVQFQVVEQSGIKLHTLNAIVASPTWAIHDGTLYFSPISQAVAAAIQKPDADKSVTRTNAKPLMAQAQSLVPAGGKTLSLSAADLTLTAPINYTAATQLLQTLTMFKDQAGVNPITYVLPPLPNILPMLGTATSATWSDQAGYHSRSVTPFPTAMATWSPQFLLFAPVVTNLAFMAHGMGKLTEQSINGIDIQNAQAIQTACIMYTANNQKQFPADLGTLVTNGKLDIKENALTTAQWEVVAPADLSTWPTPKQADWFTKNACFVLIPSGKSDAGTTRIDVVQRINPDVTTKELAVAYRDGRSEALPVEAVRQLLLKQTGKTLEQLGIAPEPGK